MGVEEEAMVGPKAKKSKRGKRNEEGIKEVSHSGNVGVEDDKRIFEKGDVMEKNNVDKGCSEKKMKLKKKKKKGNIDTEDGRKKGIEDGGIFSRDSDGEGMEDVDQKKKKKKKKKEREKRKEGLGVGSDHFVENECDACLVYNEIQDCGGKYENEGEVLWEWVAVEKVEKKKLEKREKKRDKDYVSDAQRDSNRGKAMDTKRKNGKGVEILGEGCDRKVMENVERKKMKRDKRQTENDLKGVEITGEGSDGEVMEKVERKKRKREKREKGETEDDLKGVMITGEGRDGEVTEKVERKKGKRDKGQTKNLVCAEGCICSTENEYRMVT